MNVEEVKVPVEKLKLGMYVSRLDRPWLDSPFNFQGFPLNNVELIEQIKAVCEFVYVDVERSSDKAALIKHRMGMSSPQKVDDETAKKKPVKRDKYARMAQKSSRRFGEWGLDQDMVPAGRVLKTGRGEQYTDQVEIEEELKPARQALDTCVETVRESFETLRQTGELDAEQIGQAVEGVVSSISRNPDALIWLARLGDASDYTYRHCINMSIWSVALGRQIGLPPDDLQVLGQGSLYCDLGKAKLPGQLLRRAGPLAPWETQMVRLHVDYALEILEECEGLDPAVLTTVAQHHERYDGSGYPLGLAESKIDLYGRIAAIADCFDAMTSDRCYKDGVPISDAIREMYWARGRHFQPELLEEFIHSIGLYPAGTLVELSNGAVGVVIGQSRVRRLRPRVMMLLDTEKEQLSHYPVVDLMQEDKDQDGQSLHIIHDLKHGAYGLDPAQYFF
ncbi:MAG: HD-GYP domain-containing protein [Xanthomonadales bacterium]|nr:HD-GYP domain-containing protein [Xanthomonadales bacterium]